jgi:hypothetical protein
MLVITKWEHAPGVKGRWVGQKGRQRQAPPLFVGRKAVRKMIARPQYLHQAWRDHREQSCFRLDRELYFSGEGQGTWGLNQGGQLESDAEAAGADTDVKVFGAAGQEVKIRFGSCRARSRRSACQWTGGYWRACARRVGEENWRLINGSDAG